MGSQIPSRYALSLTGRKAVMSRFSPSTCQPGALRKLSPFNVRASVLDSSHRFTTKATLALLQQTSINTHSSHVNVNDGSLTWNDFLRLRKIRRYYNLGASVGTSITSFAGGMAILAQQNLQTLGQQIFGLDPFLVMGLWTIGFLGLGWLVGPLVGTGVFRLVNRERARQMETKEKDFYARIRKYRVDPTNGASVQNPIPDYYGEKITSVAGYRQWLKDQRAFNKKRQSFV